MNIIKNYEFLRKFKKRPSPPSPLPPRMGLVHYYHPCHYAASFVPQNAIFDPRNTLFSSPQIPSIFHFATPTYQTKIKLIIY